MPTNTYFITKKKNQLTEYSHTTDYGVVVIAVVYYFTHSRTRRFQRTLFIFTLIFNVIAMVAGKCEVFVVHIVAAYSDSVAFATFFYFSVLSTCQQMRKCVRCGGGWHIIIQLFCSFLLYSFLCHMNVCTLSPSLPSSSSHTFIRSFIDSSKYSFPIVFSRSHNYAL